MGNGAALDGDADGAAAGYGGSFAHGVGDGQRLAHTGANPALAVAYDYQRVEAKAAAAFDHFGDAAGMHYALAEAAAVVFARGAFPVAAAAAPAATLAAAFTAPTAGSAAPVTRAAAATTGSAPVARAASCPSAGCWRYHQKTSPPSRAASASALTRPWKR